MAHVELGIYNLSGQQVILLLNEGKTPGYYQLNWNGDDKSGKPVASGIYIYRLKYENTVLTKKMQLLR